MMESFCSEETIDDPIECESCGKKQPSTKELRIVESADIIVVHLKRFTGLRKNSTPVKLNATLNVNNKEYKLCAMVNHSGGIGGGHYTAAEEKMEVVSVMANDNFITAI